jgi:LysR family transcriptional activator of nhaA
VARAAEELHVTPQTISGQLKLLARDLGAELFERRGRGLELTDAGRFALGYAKDIFALESELQQAIRLRPEGRRIEFRVGVADSLPKSLAYRLLEPATRGPDPVRVVCVEWKRDKLLSELAVHRLDLVLSDAPVPKSLDVRAFSHRLGESSLSFLAAPALASCCAGAFPRCLDALPILLPGEDSALRARLMRWLGRLGLKPSVVGEFDGSSLMAAFGEGGFGVFAAPVAIEEELVSQLGVVAIGRTEERLAEYYAITVERRVSHPCILAITRAARDRVFAAAPA